MSVSADLRQGWREFRSRPLVSALAVVTLALGVGRATTMFTMIKGIGLVMIPPGGELESVREDQRPNDPATERPV